MLHFHPELVRKELIPDNPSVNPPPYDLFPADREFATEIGSVNHGGGGDGGEGADHGGTGGGGYCGRGAEIL